jgi:voltage-gated potassium channel
VTITTVGYGDFYPVTTAGRIAATFIMLAGVGIIGALASILASVLVGGSSAPVEEETPVEVTVPKDENELVMVKNELAALRKLMEEMSVKIDMKE